MVSEADAPNPYRPRRNGSGRGVCGIRDGTGQAQGPMTDDAGAQERRRLDVAVRVR